MKIAVLGAGAIGGLVAGYLKDKGEDVVLIGHADAVKVIKERGLEIQGVRGDFNIKIGAAERLNFPADLAILATKTQDIAQALKDNRSFLKNALLLTTQNGVQADYISAEYIPEEKIISSIVMFAATYLEPGKVVHNFERSWIIGKIFRPNDSDVTLVSETLNKIFPTLVAEDIKGMKYLKIFLNANNCIPGILGVSMQEAFADARISRLAVYIWKEGLDIVNKCGINLVSLPDFPLERLEKLTSMPTDQAVKIFSGMMYALSKEPLYGSVLQSIKRKRPSEIDYLNGEFVRLAKEHNLEAPLNEKLVRMVHDVEQAERFFSADELISKTQGGSGLK